MLLALKTKLAVKAGLVAMSLGAAAMNATPNDPSSLAPATITLRDINLSFRPAGDFQRDGEPTDAPLQQRHFDRIEIMKTQVSAAEYAACVADDACAATTEQGAENPATRVSWQDAQAYARWLSTQTGDFWRLPTDAEWAAAAGSRFIDNALRLPAGSSASDRWLATYEAEAAGRGDDALRPRGGYGVNEHGVQDVGGSVWEWTDTCFTRYVVADGETKPGAVNCGVRVVEGAHRSYVTNFIRDARAGGCAVGKPPSHLGIRLVRETRPLGRHFVKLIDKVGLR
ncbi:MAG: putative nitrate reductase [Hyphomicrobiales bacterium]|nr:putative nitrate reductase [Hyphomicrobiales bacterium]